MVHEAAPRELDRVPSGAAAQVQHPTLRRPGGSLVELHHVLDDQLEAALLRELADPALDAEARAIIRAGQTRDEELPEA